MRRGRERRTRKLVEYLLLICPRAALALALNARPALH